MITFKVSLILYIVLNAVNVTLLECIFSKSFSSSVGFCSGVQLSDFQISRILARLAFRHRSAAQLWTVSFSLTFKNISFLRILSNVPLLHFGWWDHRPVWTQHKFWNYEVKSFLMEFSSHVCMALYSTIDLRRFLFRVLSLSLQHSLFSSFLPTSSSLAFLCSF